MSASGQGLTCAICLRRLRCCRLGKPLTCDHVFCFTCIFEWAKNVNTCPVDRMKFNTIEVFESVGGKCIEKVFIPDQDVDAAADMTNCEICQDHRREHELLLCDGCDKGYHLNCLSPPLSEVPGGDWYCPVCQPIIDAQYFDSFESSGSEVETKWDTSSDSDISNTRRRHRAHRVLISESEESESDSDIDELRTIRKIQNICAIGEHRVLISESSESNASENEIVAKHSHKKSIVSSENGGSQATEISSSSQHTKESGSFSEASGYCSDDRQPQLTTYKPDIVSRGDSYVSFLKRFSRSTEDCPQLVQSPHHTTSAREQSPITLVKKEADSSTETLQAFTASQLPSRIQKQTVSKSSVRVCVSKHTASDSTAGPSQSTSQPPPGSLNKNRKRRKRNRNRKRKRRRKIVLGKSRPKKRYRPDQVIDGTYNPSRAITMNDREAIGTRGKARTVASYTPHQLTFREAVRESYRHSDTGTGLENARRIILESGVDPNSFQHHTPKRAPWSFIQRTPQSGYCTPNSEFLVRDSRYTAQNNLSRTPLSTSDNGFQERITSEINRRTVPKSHRKLVTVFQSPSSGLLQSPMTYSNPPGQCGTSSDGGLVDEICQNLDNLNSSENIIKRDGSIMPLRDNQFSCSYASLAANFRPSPTTQLENLPQNDKDTTSEQVGANRPIPFELDLDSDSTESELIIDEEKNNEQESDHSLVLNKAHAMPRDELQTGKQPAKSHSDPPSKRTISNKSCKHNQSNSKTGIQAEEPSSSTDSVRMFVDVKSLPSVEKFVKAALDKYYGAGDITRHQYKRILERSSNKVKAGKTTTLERVEKLVADFVDVYRLSSC